MFQTAGTLSPREVTDLQADARALVTDADTGTAAVVRVQGARGYDPLTGTMTHAETATNATVYMAPLTTKEIERIAGAKVGDVKALLSTATLARVPVGSRVVVGTTDYQVFAVESGPVDAYLTLFCHRGVS